MFDIEKDSDELIDIDSEEILAVEDNKASEMEKLEEIIEKDNGDNEKNEENEDVDDEVIKEDNNDFIPLNEENIEIEDNDTSQDDSEDNKLSGFFELLNSPIGKLLFKEGTEALMMNMMKKTFSKEIADKGAEFLAENLLNLRSKDSMKDIKRVRGKKRRKRLLEQKAQERAKSKEDLKKILEKQITTLLK